MRLGSSLAIFSYLTQAGTVKFMFRPQPKAVFYKARGRIYAPIVRTSPAKIDAKSDIFSQDFGAEATCTPDLRDFNSSTRVRHAECHTRASVEEWGRRPGPAAGGCIGPRRNARMFVPADEFPRVFLRLGAVRKRPLISPRLRADEDSRTSSALLCARSAPPFSATIARPFACGLTLNTGGPHARPPRHHSLATR